MEIKNIVGTPIPQVPKELYANKNKDSVFEQTIARNKLMKIVADTAYGDDRGDVCTDPTHNHPKEWHHGVSYPESGGVFVYHLSFPYPEKGARDDLMMMSIQFVKRMFINWTRFLVYALTHFYRPIKVLEKFFVEFLDYAHMVNENGKHFILEKRYYTNQGRELIKGLEVFLNEIGISVSEDMAWTFVALIDNDTAYYYPLADVLSLADKQRLLKNPIKECKFLINSYKEREIRKKVAKNIGGFFIILNILWIPKYRRAFRKAIEAMDFSKLGLDEADRWHVRNMGGYNYFGRTREDRLKEWPLTQHTLAEVQWNDRR